MGNRQRFTKRLHVKGCIKAYDFTQLSDIWVKKNLAITGYNLKKDLEGISRLKLEFREAKKAIATTRSFEYTFSDIENIKERISTFAASCAEKLRAQNSSCYMVIVILRGNYHKKDTVQHKASKTIIFSHPTNSTLTISKSAVKAVSSIFKKGLKYKRAGVIVTGLVPEDNFQLNLFSKENPKHKPLMQTIDKLNRTFKAEKIKLANSRFKTNLENASRKIIA